MRTNVIYNKSCVKMDEMDDGSIDLTVTSPPYDNLRTYGGYEFNFGTIARELHRVTKLGGVVVWVIGDATIKGSETGTSLKQALYFKQIGFNLHDTMIYQKINYTPLTHNRYEQTFEYMFVFSKGRPKTFNPRRLPCKNFGKVEKYGMQRRKNYGKQYAMRLYNKTTYIETRETKIHPNIFPYALGREKTGHPAPFPNQLAIDHILSWSNENDIILDPMAGSETTLAMARRHNRQYIGYEINKKYIPLIRKRLAKEDTLFNTNNKDN